MRDSQQINFQGKLNTDVAPELLGGGDYPDAKNIHSITENTESTGAHIPVRGNLLAYDLGSVSAQDKVWRVYTTDAGVAATGGLLFFDMNGFGSPALMQTWNRNQSVTLQTAAIQVFLDAIFGAGNSVASTDGSTYVDIVITQFFTPSSTGYDWGLQAYTDPIFPTTSSEKLVIAIIQEGYDITLTGELNDIASNDLLGDLYIWSTPQKHLPEVVADISSVADNGTNFFLITTAAPHGLSNGMKVVISGVIYTGTPIVSPNNTWIVSVLSPTTFNVLEYHAINVLNTVYVSGGTVTLYTEAIGEIGAAVKDLNSALWTYTRLLRTKEWNFRTKYQIDARPSVRTSAKDSFYFTDDYNAPRVFYYTKPFITDGALTINGGRYDYGSIDDETRNILTTADARITFVSQTQSGGAVRSGNWRYAIRFLTDTLSPTDWSDVTNPVNVYTAASNGNPNFIIGDDSGITTGKINELLVTKITPALFKYIELAGINYVGDAIEGFVIKRVLLDGVSTTLNIQHTGTETDVVNLDLGTLDASSALITTAKSNEIIDNRLVYSNLTIAQQNDLSAWAQSFTHILAKKAINSVRSPVHGTSRFAEYQDYSNVNTNMGYMFNETYRFVVKVLFKKNKFWSDGFWIDDIAFTTFATNLDPNGNAVSPDPTRRVGTFSDFDLTDIVALPQGTTTVYVPYVHFSNIDLDFLIDGIPVKDLIESFSIERAEVIPEILSCGEAVLGINGSTDTSGKDGANADQDVIIASDAPPAQPPTAGTNIIDFPYVSGRLFNAFVTGNPTYTPFAAPDNIAARRKYASFYSPDLWFNNTDISFVSGDKVINHGNPLVIAFNTGYLSSFAGGYSNYGEWSGVTTVDSTTVQLHTLDSDTQVVVQGGNATIGGVTFSKQNQIGNTNIGGGDTTSDNPTSLVLYDSITDFTNPNVYSDYGFYYTQYYRAISNKYGDITNTQSVTCGHFFDIGILSGVQTTDVFGGDTFTQINFFRHRLADVELTRTGGGISFYCQNRINAQMKNKSTGSTQDLYPAISTTTWLESVNLSNEAYQRGYNIKNEVQSTIAFDPNADNTSDRPTWIQWSELNNLSGGKDNFRVFLPLNFHVLDQSFGEIVHHANGNGELITWQDRKFQRQYFNTRGQLDTGGLGIIIGDGSVMSRDGVTLSLYGCQHKWSVIKGKSNGGGDVFYWINQELKKALRFGYDGTVSIADIKGLQSFFANNLTWVQGKDTPADEEGICGVWDERFKEMIWTVVGKNTGIDYWNVPPAAYSINTVVFYSSDPFNRIGDAYISLANANINNQPDISPTWWLKLPDNGAYLNNYSIVFNEFKNGFSCFATPVPRIYLQWRDSYLTPRPISAVSENYEHHQGNLLQWYDNGSTLQEEKGFIEGVVNKGYPDTKWYEAIGVDSDIVPKRIEFATKTQISYLDDTEFETREDSSYSPIKEDSTVTITNPSGLNDTNSSLLYGKWLKAKFIFDINIYQRLLDFTVKFRISPRIKSK